MDSLLFCILLLFFTGSAALEELDQLHDGNDANAQRKREQELPEADAGEAEGIAQEGDEHHRHRADQTDRTGQKQQPVAGFDLQQALALGTHIEAVECFGKAHGEKCHGGADAGTDDSAAVGFQ